MKLLASLLPSGRKFGRALANRFQPEVSEFEPRLVPTAGLSSISSNFNGTVIAAGSSVWFNSVFSKVSGVGSSAVTLHVTNQSVSFTVNGVLQTDALPDSLITLSPSATSASTSFDAANNTWDTTLPLKFGGNAFLGGGSVAVPAGLPGGLNPVTWQGQFSSDTPGVSLNWQWGAAVYTNFDASLVGLGVKAADGKGDSSYPNGDHAGTPEAFKAYVTGGARGGGGANYTGGLSGTASISTTLYVPPPPPVQSGPSSLSGVVTDTAKHVGFAGITVTLTGTDSLGNAVSLTTTTAADGTYNFTGLAAGTYTLTAAIPNFYVDTGDMAGTVGGTQDGTTTQPGTGVISSIALGAGQNGINYDFGFLFYQA
jgi:hypothetical protein